MVEWSITTVLKTVVLQGTGGSNPSLSANKGVNQQVMQFTPFITPQKLHCLRKLIAYLLLQYSFVFVKVTTITHTNMIYGYIRVSSDKQTVENQRFEINNFCEHQNLSIDDWIEETISGTKNYTKRQLGNLLKKINKDDIIICSELSRLGRNLFMIMEILNICMTKECRVWTIKDNYRLGDDIQSKVLAFAFGLSAEIERNLISQRTKEALARKKAEGVVLGRRKGSKNKKHKLDNKKMLIKKSLERGISKTVLAHILKVSRNTLYLFLQRTNLSEVKE